MHTFSSNLSLVMLSEAKIRNIGNRSEQKRLIGPVTRNVWRTFSATGCCSKLLTIPGLSIKNLTLINYIRQLVSVAAPLVGLCPNIPLKKAGIRMDPPISEPF